jgi:hypothetical protein
MAPERSPETIAKTITNIASVNVMNFKHPYEKHLAEKLVQLPPPDDPDQNWQQMKVLLDKNMPRGGGGPGGSYRWWIAGTIIVAVVVGTWFGGKTFLSKEQRNENVAGTIKSVNNKNAPSVASTDKNAGQQKGASSANPTTGGTTEANNNLPGAAYASTTSTPNSSTASTSDQQQQAAGNKTDANNSTATENNVAVTNNSGKGNALTIEEAEKARSSGNNESTSRLLTANDNNKGANETPTNRNNKTTVDRNKIYTPVTKNDRKRTGTDRTTNDRRLVNNHRTLNNNTGDQLSDDADGVALNAASDRLKNKNSKGKKPVKKAGADVNKPAKEEREESGYTYKPTISLPSQPTTGSGLKESPVDININYTGSLVVSPSGVVQREFTYYTQAELFPDMVAHNKTSGRKKSSHATRSQEDKTFAIGLSLPLAFPVGDQHALGYNSRGGVNTISDYIPSPHFQYHFNNKTYMQAGLQFSSPQFIRPILLYQSQQMGQPGPTVRENITSITARKLYYFNLPVTIYHSPLRNFYMGTGLQYSRLLSGIAYHEEVERRYNSMGPAQETLLKSYVTRFKNDMLSRRLNSDEVRLLLDMSYYWSRFTVGLQYNQAFNNYVSFQVTPSSPYTFDKNKSLQFYLRYNIWEDKKRKKIKGGPMLTLK